MINEEILLITIIYFLITKRTSTMKKIFLLLVAVAMTALSVRAAETTVFTGPVVIGDWDNYAVVGAFNFADAEVGDEVYVYTSGIGSSAQGAFQVPTGSWPALTTALGSFDITGDFSFAITAEELTTLKASGLAVKGKNYTIEKVVLKNSKSSTTMEETTVFSTETVTGNWAKYAQIDASKFTNLEVGDKIYIYTKDVLSGAQGSIKDQTGDWPGLTTALAYFDISGDFYCTVDAEMLAKIQADGIVVTGQKYTIVKVVIQHPTSSETISNEFKVYAGPTVMPSDWSANAIISAGMFGDLVIGDVIYVYTTDVKSEAQGSFKSPSDWAGITTKTAYFDITGDFKLIVDADVLAKLQTSGLAVSGKNYTLVKVVIRSSKKATPFERVALSTAATATGNWENKVVLAASSFADAKVGDKIYVTTSNVLSGAQGAFQLPVGDSWPGLTTALQYFDITGDYYCKIIDETMLNNLKASGLAIAGKKYTIEEVDLLKSDTTLKFTNELFPMTQSSDLYLSEATFDATTKAITFKASGIAGWQWSAAQDLTKYNYVSVELEDNASSEITIQVTYKNKATDDLFTIPAGKKFASVKLDEKYKDAVEGIIIYMSDSKAASVVLSNVYGVLLTTGVESVAMANDAQVISIKYYNAAGMQISKLSKGVNLVRKQLSDGSIKCSKILNK